MRLLPDVAIDPRARSVPRRAISHTAQRHPHVGRVAHRARGYAAPSDAEAQFEISDTRSPALAAALRTIGYDPVWKDWHRTVTSDSTPRARWREPAPPYSGEVHALWHVSEDPGLDRFEPHVAPASAEQRRSCGRSTRHVPTFWFPRNCPRGCAWIASTTTVEDRVRFLGHSSALASRDRVRVGGADARLHPVRPYRFPMEAVPRASVGGYWVADETVHATEQTTWVTSSSARGRGHQATHHPIRRRSGTQ